ncbi:hypothetical protein BH23ACT2_BH23ACT2_23800 [soil metagenome]
MARPAHPRWPIAAIAALIGTACTASTTAELVDIAGTGAQGRRATVSEVVDGDTVELRFGSGPTERARILGIDTPETVHPNRPVECFGPEASTRAGELIPPGTEVAVQRDEEARDRYGRLLVYVWRADDGLFFNQAMVAEGYAETLSIAPNNAFRVELSAAAAEARAAGAGLWSACSEEGEP